VNECTFIGNTTDMGGAMYANGSMSQLNSCTFMENEAYYGGAIQERYSVLSITNSTFENNKSIRLWNGQGGAIASTESTLMLTHCTFTANTCSLSEWGQGGAVVLLGTSATIMGCSFSNNETSYEGGAIYTWAANLDMQNCVFTENNSKFGGGVFFEGTTTLSGIKNCIFKDNTAVSGGGLVIYGDFSEITVEKCDFIGNKAEDEGGGASNRSYSESTYYDCTFVDNEALQDGGGMHNNFQSKSTCKNCLFYNNRAERGASVFSYLSEAYLLNCTLSGNRASRVAGGVYSRFASETQIRNSILWENEPDEIFTATGSSMLIEHSDVQGHDTGSGNINADPLFVDPMKGDFHLTYDSPCKNNGWWFPGTPPYDIEGDARTNNGGVDIGFDEFHPHFYCIGDFTPGGAVQGNLVGDPGTTPLALFVSSALRSWPLQLTWGTFYLESPYYGFVFNLPMPSNGVLSMPTHLPSGTPAPYDLCMQGFVGTGSKALTNPFVLEVR